MLRLLPLAFLMSPAYACPERIEAIGAGCDAIEIVSTSDTSAVVRYTNCHDKSSVPAVVNICVGGMRVEAQIEVGSLAEHDGREIVTLRPSGDFVAYPEQDQAEDGQTVELIVALPMF